ncbi:MAG: hypothetical protein WCB67_15730 [Solirubrobacteraceae bacterium]
MFCSFRRLPALSVLAVCAGLLAPVAGAQASNSTLLATVGSYNGKILRDEAAVLNGLAAYQSHRSAPLIHALRHEVSDLHALAAKLSHQSGSTAKGTRAKSDITKGLGLIASAYAALAAEVEHSSASNPVSKSQLQATVKTDLKGRADLRAGLKLLG